MTLVQTEPKKITLGGNITDMQGPCPAGYHVPSKDENVALVAAMTALGIDTSNGNCMKTYLKMPFAGYRLYSSAGVYGQGTSAYYWSSTAYSADYAYYLFFYSAGLNPQNSYYRSYGFSVRCFKNSPLQPTSSWTTLFDGSGIAAGAGIFHNTTDGVISISSDGTNWITIADKNLGATTVYNDGDTLSQANCGNYYQRGNNYGFPRTGSVTTSSTQVDASNYGPGNYYNSSTFITRSSSPYDWSSVQNDNLRGGVTGGEKEIKKVCMWIGGTEKQIRPAGGGWQPGPNTIAYYPLNSNTTNTDQSGNGYDLTANGTLTYTGVGGVSAINTSAGYLSGTITTIPVGNAARTLSIWEYLNSNSTAAPDFKVMWYYGNRRKQHGEQMLGFNTNIAVGCIYLANYYDDLVDWNKDYLCDLYKWYHILYTYDGTTQTIYLNGAPILSQQQTINTNSNAFQIGNSSQGTNFPGYLSEMIIEDRAWSAQEVSDYFDLTKGNYGL